MRVLLLFPLLAAAVIARPQASSSSDWKPIETDTQRLRVENQETRNHKTVSNSALKDSVQQLTNQLTKSNRSTEFTMDTRTPPKIRFQQKNIEKKRLESIENSHPGIAVPVDVDMFYESTTQSQKRPIIYRNENKTPTPDSGISTWILLSGQSTTSKPVRKQPTIKTTTSTTTTESEINKTNFMTEKPIKSTIKIKPLTTRKIRTTTLSPTTTKSAITTTTVATTKLSTTQFPQTTEKKLLMTKIKASVLNNAVKNKTVTTTTTTTVPPSTTNVVTTEMLEKKKEITKSNTTSSENNEINELEPEAKDGTLDLAEKSDGTTKRPRRPVTTNKRKKNTTKTRRRKPTNGTMSEKIDTAVGNISKPATKEKPIGTQLYNYLSREIMPTVGVGLVGLMVTAGLASYFFYPFGGLRRTFDTAMDRKDYYYDDYTVGGMAEEELIGKVIAGMPEHTDYSPNSYRTHLARKDAYKNDVNYNYRNSESYYPYPNNDYHTVSIGSKIGYGRDVITEHQKESGYTVDANELEKNQFVVGNIPKEFEPITSDPVPEHGPRSLRIRRFAQNDEDNEIIDFKYDVTKDKKKYASVGTVHPYYKQKTSTTIIETTPSERIDSTSTEESTTETTILLQPEQPNFFSFLRNLLELKVRLGLDLLVRTTDSVSNYLRGVQERVNNVLKEENSRAPPSFSL